MKKILLCFSFLLSLGTAWAQERVISGKVTSAEDGSPLPGVSVVLKGTVNGTSTDSGGSYKLNVPASGGSLVFSFIGLKSSEIQVGERSVIDISLSLDVQQMNEVVVTALGIEKTRNELAYAAQQVNGNQISANRSVNFVNSLSGKVAGVDIKSSNVMGGSTNVVIRGYKSISGNNQALFVIDGIPVSNANTNTSTQRAGGAGVDYGNAAADINPDNIASVNVLRGAAATALYGSRAANGVIMITTKKGRKNSFEVVVNSGVTWGKMDKSTFPRYQKEYGGGYDGIFGPSKTYDGITAPSVVYADDASFGPKFDDQPIFQWNSLDPFSPYYHKTTPWAAAKNDPSTFYETAINSNQSFSIAAGGDKTTYKFGYTRNDEKGMLPNSTLDKDLFNFSASSELTKKLTVTSSANYSRIKGIGRYGTGYQSRNPNQGFRQWWQMNVDIKELKEAYFRNRKNVTWNWNSAGTGPIYASNPYWSRYENFSNDSRDNTFGYATLNYKITNWVDVLARVGFDGTQDMQEERVAVGSEGQASYTRFNRSFVESNYDLIANFNKNITADFSFRGLIGSNMRRSRLSSIRTATNGGLVVPYLYSLSNSLNSINPPTEEYERVGVDGLFVNANFGYKDIAFIELSGRQDKSTTLPKDNNTYRYYSAAGNIVFSNLLKMPWLSLGKLRANYARVGNDASALSLYDVYDKPTAIGSVPYFSLPNTKNNSALRPEYTNSYEIGLEAEVLEGRGGFDLTWYQASSFDQILSVSVTGATGYTGKWVNSGEIQNKGIELSAFVTPVEFNGFSWRLNVNFTRNRNEVIYLYGEGDGEVKNYPITSLQGNVTLNAAKGEPYGVIKGTNFQYVNGERLVGTNGTYTPSATTNEIIGNPNPKWLAGINNTLKYKDISLSFLIDIRHGGQLFSLDQFYGEGTGMYKNTAGLNDKGIESRLPLAQGGGVLLPGVQADGSPNTIYAANTDGSGNTPFGYAANDYAGAPRAWYVYDASYVKLREASVNYALPRELVNRVKLKGVDVSLVGRNLWIIHKNLEYADPEEGLSSGNANGGYQSGAYPVARTYGFNVKLTF